MSKTDRLFSANVVGFILVAAVMVALAAVIADNSWREKPGTGDVPKAVCHFARTDARTLFLNATIRDTGNKNDVATGLYAACNEELNKFYNK